MPLLPALVLLLLLIWNTTASALTDQNTAAALPPASESSSQIRPTDANLTVDARSHAPMQVVDRQQVVLWHNLLLLGLPALAAVVAILIAMLRINRRLTSEISRRIALEQELRSSEYHYRGLIEIGRASIIEA